MFDRIVEVRKEKGLRTSQTAIAAVYGVNQSAVGKWADGKGAHRDLRQVIALELGVYPEWLDSGLAPKYLLHPDTEKILELLDSHDEDYREGILRYCEFLDQD